MRTVECRLSHVLLIPEAHLWPGFTNKMMIVPSLYITTSSLLRSQNLNEADIENANLGSKIHIFYLNLDQNNCNHCGGYPWEPDKEADRRSQQEECNNNRTSHSGGHQAWLLQDWQHRRHAGQHLVLQALQTWQVTTSSYSFLKDIVFLIINCQF